MQTLISRARDISPRAGRCNISRKRDMSLFLSLSPFLSGSVSCVSLRLTCVRITHYAMSLHCAICHRTVNAPWVSSRETKIPRSLVSPTEISSQQKRGARSFFTPVSGCALMYGMCIGPCECVRDRAWPYVTVRARSRAARRAYSESFLFARAKNMLTRATGERALNEERERGK